MENENKTALDLIREGYEANSPEPVTDRRTEGTGATDRDLTDDDLPVFVRLSRGFAERDRQKKESGEE